MAGGALSVSRVPKDKGGTFWPVDASIAVEDVTEGVNTVGTVVISMWLVLRCRVCHRRVASVSGFEATGVERDEHGRVVAVQVDGWKARRFSNRKAGAWKALKAGGTFCGESCYRASRRFRRR